MRERELEQVREALLIGLITVKYKRDLVKEGLILGIPEQIESDLDDIETALTVVSEELIRRNEPDEVG